MDNLLSIILNIIISVSGFVAIFIYIIQNRAKKRDAAALIVDQIENLKEKMLQINNITINNTLDERAFYESLDIISENMWDKYKHLFIKKIDPYSFKIINNFYESILKIREQLLFTKELQHQQYYNIQLMMNSNINELLLKSFEMSISYPIKKDYQSIVGEIESKLDGDDKTKFLELFEDFSNSKINYDNNRFASNFNVKKELLANSLNMQPYIPYIPQQISDTLNKVIRNANSIEIIGCEGYKKLKKIAKIK